MRKYSEAKIISILKQARETKITVGQLCREHSISDATYYAWRSKYSGLDASKLSQISALEKENAQLKRMYADVQIQNELLKETLSKK